MQEVKQRTVTISASKHWTRLRQSVAVSIALLGGAAAQAEVLADWLGVDNFEFPPATAYRIESLALRDPHVFLQTPLGCVDFTDQTIPFTDVSFNGQLNDALNGDLNPADGFLDASSLLLFHPASSTDGSLQRLDQVAGACTAPAVGTSCTDATGAVPTVGTYLSSAAGACLEGIAGTTSGYTPGLPNMGSPCWLTRASDLQLDAQGVIVPLTDAQQGGQWATPSINQGLLRGFVSEVVAEQIMIPNPVPGQPAIVLASLLPGGSGSCAAGDDRDINGGISGWWFYLEFAAGEVGYAQP